MDPTKTPTSRMKLVRTPQPQHIIHCATSSSFYQVLLLLALVASEVASRPGEPRQKWRLCGFLDLPFGLSPGGNFGSRTVRLDPSGSLHCSCSDENAVVPEIIKADLADGEGKFFTTLNVTIYPCLLALCNHRMTSSVDVSNFTSVELFPPSCAKSIILRKTDDAGIEISVGSKLQKLRCELPPYISLSQTLSRYLAESDTGVVNVRWLVPLDMGSCAGSLMRNGPLHATAQLVFRNSNENELPHFSSSLQARHSIVRRSNNPPSFVSSYYSAQVPENSPIGTLVATAEATDIDEGINEELIYTMVPSTNHLSAEFFQIHNTSGQITTKGELTMDTVHTWLLILLCDIMTLFDLGVYCV